MLSRTECRLTPSSCDTRSSEWWASNSATERWGGGRIWTRSSCQSCCSKADEASSVRGWVSGSTVHDAPFSEGPDRRWSRHWAVSRRTREPTVLAATRSANVRNEVRSGLNRSHFSQRASRSACARSSSSTAPSAEVFRLCLREARNGLDDRDRDRQTRGLRRSVAKPVWLLRRHRRHNGGGRCLARFTPGCGLRVREA